MVSDAFLHHGKTYVHCFCLSDGNRCKESMEMQWRLTLVIQQFLSRLSGVLGVGALNNGVDGAGFLAETAVDALGHVDIVTGGSARAIGTLFGFNGDGLGRADLGTVSGRCFWWCVFASKTYGFAELAGNAALFSRGVSSEGVFATESGRDGTLYRWLIGMLERIDEVVGRCTFSKG